MAITPGGRVGDARPLARPGYKGKRKLSDYEREVAHALMRKGTPKKRAIMMARGIIRNAASRGKWGKGKASGKVRAGAAASIAQRKSFSAPAGFSIDLGGKPNPGTGPDKRLKANKKRRKKARNHAAKALKRINQVKLTAGDQEVVVDLALMAEKAVELRRSGPTTVKSRLQPKRQTKNPERRSKRKRRKLTKGAEQDGKKGSAR